MIKNGLRACRVVTHPELLKCLKSTASQIDPAILKKLDEGYEKLSESHSKSLLKKHLTPSLFESLRTKTGKTSTLLDCIQSGLAHHDSGCGVYAPEAEAYTVFADLFDPIIAEYHFGFKSTDTHPDSNFGNPCHFGDLDPLRHYIASTRIRCARSVEGYPFNPRMTKQHYDEIEDLVVCALSGMTNDLEGKYMPLLGMEKSVQQKLIDDHFLFKVGDRFLRDANANRFWPTGRGIYHNFDKTFVVWCNEEDHIRIISMQKGGDFAEVFSRLVRGLSVMERKIVFVHDSRLGYLTFCPTNLGTTIRASVHIRLPKLAANKKQLEEIANQYKLQVRGTRGEHSDAEGGIYDISNKRRLGITEYDVVKELYSGISEIIRMEKAEKGQASPKKEGKKKPPSKTAPKGPAKGAKKLVAKMGLSEIIIMDKGHAPKAPLKPVVQSAPIAKTPSETKNEPAKRHAKPAPIAKTPPETKNEPAKRHAKPAPIAKTPSETKNEPAKRHAKPAPIAKTPPETKNEPAKRHAKPAPIAKTPPKTNNEPAKGYAKPAPIAKTPPKTNNEPAKRHAKPAPIAKTPPKTNNEPAKGHAKPAPIAKTPPKTNNEPAKGQAKQAKKPTTYRDKRPKSPEALVITKEITGKKIEQKDKKTDGKSDKSSGKKPGSK